MSKKTSESKGTVWARAPILALNNGQGWGGGTSLECGRFVLLSVPERQGYQRRPRVIGIRWVPAPTVTAGRPLGMIPEAPVAGVRMSR